MFSVRAPVGAINVADQIYGIGRGLCAITPIAENSQRYLLHGLEIVKCELFSVATGSTYEAVSVEQIGNVRCLLPPSEEQQTIAAFLDRETAKIDALIAEQQKLVELLKEKRQALISHAVTKGLNPDAPMKDSGIEWLGEVPKHWEVKPIKSVSTCNDDVFDEKTPADYEIEYVEISGVDADRGISETVTVLFGDAPSRARRRVKNGDVIVSTVRTYLGTSTK